MTKTTKIALSMLAASAMIVSANAVPITGTVNFTGGAVTLDNSPAAPAPGVPVATTIEAFSGSTVVSTGLTAPTGSYSGTDNSSVTWGVTPIQFATYNQTTGVLTPNLGSPVSPLWTFMKNGLTYSFNLSGISFVSEGIETGTTLPFLTIGGLGTVTITGTGSPYTTTAGSFTLSTTGSGSPTGVGTQVAFNFIAGTTAVPESGTTAMLLGLGVISLAIFAKFRKTAVA